MQKLGNKPSASKHFGVDYNRPTFSQILIFDGGEKHNSRMLEAETHF
jgi:hypothetical protein